MLENEPLRTKVRIAMQGWEIEAEGTQEFVQTGLLALVEKMSEIQRAAGPAPALASLRTADPVERPTQLPAGYSQVSTNTIASLSNASTGADLVMAAMAYITLVQRKETAARSELLEEMKAAKTFYRDSYSGNLTSYLDRLARAKKLNLVAKETYALANSERQIFERLIATAS